jgi:uncharacterized protein
MFRSRRKEHMRRAEKQIKNRREIDTILSRATICRIGLIDQGIPYIVPLNFGYKDNCLYFHSAPDGKKIELLKRNPTVCFEAEDDLAIINTGIPCKWSMHYKSIIGQGAASFITEPDQKKEALSVIVDHYSPGTSYEFPEKNLNDIIIIKIEINQITGKKSQP